MRTERGEALSILRKWLEESTPLCCQFNFVEFAACCDVRVVSVSDSEVRAKSEEGKSEVAVVLDRVVCFGYGDTRDVPSEAEDFDSGLILFFDDPDNTDDFERIVFMECARSKTCL